MLIELAGGKEALTYAHALEATALGCGFGSWRELVFFTEQGDAAKGDLPTQIMALDSKVDNETRMARRRNQRKAIQKYLKCSIERAIEISKAWGLTHTTQADTPRGKDAGKDNRDASRSPRRESVPERTANRRDNRSSNRSSNRDSNRASNRPSGRSSNRSNGDRPFRPDPLVSGIFLSGGDAPTQSTLRVSDGVTQVAPSRGRGRSAGNGRSTPERSQRPNPLQTSTFVARKEERPLREVRDDDFSSSYSNPQRSSSAAVTYKKRRTIEEQPVTEHSGLTP